VVVDLAGGSEARVVETSDGLEVLFGEGQPAPMMVAEAAAAPPEQEPAAPGSSQAIAEEATEVEPVAVAEAESVAPGQPEPVMVASAPAAGAVPSPAPVAPQPRQVALFEALDMPQEPSPVATAGEAPNYAALEVGEVETKYTGEPINFALRDADIREVLRTFAKLSGLNVIVQPGVTGSVTVQFEQVPWDQALEQILKINGLWYELEGNIMRIAPRDVLNAEAAADAERRKAVELSVPLRTIVKRVSYASASEVASLLRSGGQGGLLSQRGSVTIDARTNTLIIKELPSFMDSVLAIIEELDEPEPQVLIEARIVETTKRTSRSLGIAWGFEGNANAALGNTTGLDFPNNIASEGSVNLLTGGQNGLIGITLGNVLDSFILDAQLQAAESDGLINILSTPKIATLNNERAEIQSGLQIPIQTVSNNTVTVQFVNATLRLAVTPQVTAEGTVLMDIDIQKREPQLAFAIAGAANAPIATKEAKTRVIVRDGGTTVIGGIYEVSADQGQDRVPGLANIPFLGRLFKNNRRTDENEELLIFITPRVIKI
jgi:type IV pilus assembly protein PilQ